MKSTHEIQTVEEFRQVTTLRVGVVVITDTLRTGQPVDV